MRHYQKRMGNVFLRMSGSAPRIELLLQLAQLDTCVIFAATGLSDDLAQQRKCHLCKRASVRACPLQSHFISSADKSIEEAQEPRVPLASDVAICR
jgi:hypothetical protein